MNDDSVIEFRSDVTVQLHQHIASDRGVVQAALVSTAGEDVTRLERTPARREGLINFLMRDRHGSPFEHNSMTFFISAPIFVFREFMRHRVGWSYNEESGRYRRLEPVFYIPDAERKLIQIGKPGAYTFEHGSKLTHLYAVETMKDQYTEAYEAYATMLDAGIAREVARSVLPVGLYSSMFATCNARSLMHFLSLRTTHKDAKVVSFPQREIEMVGEQMEKHFAQLMPMTYEAYNSNGRVAP